MIRRPPRSTRLTHSFPTRRSSDLAQRLLADDIGEGFGGAVAQRLLALGADADLPLLLEVGHQSLRSEEHTSELQSLMRISYAVFCLKKKTQQPTHSNHLLKSTHVSQQLPHKYKRINTQNKN